MPYPLRDHRARASAGGVFPSELLVRSRQCHPLFRNGWPSPRATPRASCSCALLCRRLIEQRLTRWLLTQMKIRLEPRVSIVVRLMTFCCGNIEPDTLREPGKPAFAAARTEREKAPGEGDMRASATDGAGVATNGAVAVTAAPRRPNLLDQLRDTLRSRHYSRRTDQNEKGDAPLFEPFSLFVVVEHWNPGGPGWHVATHDNRDAAAEALAVAVKSILCTALAHAACRVPLRHDHRSAFMSEHVQNLLDFLAGRDLATVDDRRRHNPRDRIRPLCVRNIRARFTIVNGRATSNQDCKPGGRR